MIPTIFKFHVYADGLFLEANEHKYLIVSIAQNSNLVYVAYDSRKVKHQTVRTFTVPESIMKKIRSKFK